VSEWGRRGRSRSDERAALRVDLLQQKNKIQQKMVPTGYNRNIINIPIRIRLSNRALINGHKI
jgi:hypothetical protein